MIDKALHCFLLLVVVSIVGIIVVLLFSLRGDGAKAIPLGVTLFGLLVTVIGIGMMFGKELLK